MKIKIDKMGLLEIERVGVWNSCTCPFHGGQDANRFPFGYCGEWCPQFGEPISLAGMVDKALSKLTICQGRILTGEIIDERPRP